MEYYNNASKVHFQEGASCIYPALASIFFIFGPCLVRMTEKLNINVPFDKSK